MLNRLLFRPALHEHAEPAQRVLGLAELPPEAPELAQLLRADPAPQVRAAAAERCVDAAALTAAWQAETDADVRAAIAASLGKVLAATADHAGAHALLAAENCTDALRAAVAYHTQDAELRRVAVDGVRAEAVLVELALTAAHAATRLAAADRVRSPQALQRLAEAAGDKDRGVARIARRRIAEGERLASHAADADAILAQAEALVNQPGPIVTAAVELDRRWKALDLGNDPERNARWDALTQTLQARFEREHEAQRERARFERRLNEWLAALPSPPAAGALQGMRSELLALRAQAQERNDAAALAKLEQAEQQLARWEQALPVLAAAEALVVEAEQLAAGTPIDDGQLPQRWHALDRAARTPALTRRFEAALLVIEQRRMAYVRAAKEQEGAARHQLHALLVEAEQALAAGQLQAARAAVDAVKPLKAAAGVLPKPTVQRLGRLMQQLTELERWQSFGQHSARLQLCERAEALAGQTLEPAQLARHVQKLRADWKELDQQQAGVPKALWERFDRACEKAYAPAARHFAEVAAQHKQARKRRDEFIAAAAAHAPTLLTEPRDWRAIERWLRDTDHAWRSGDLGSVEPDAWKKLDTRLKAALAPAREALSAARSQAKAERRALIAQAAALAAKVQEHDAPAQVRELQAKWKAQATAMPLAHRDEQALWEEFRAACDAVFAARQNRRKEADQRKHEQRRPFVMLCEQLEQLARATDQDEAEVRRLQRDLQAQWQAASAEPVAPPLAARFKSARAAVEAMLAARTRAREAAVWQALAAKERLCDELDALVMANPAEPAAAAASVRQRWDALEPLPAEWETRLAARRDAALHALTDEDAHSDYVAQIEDQARARTEALLELELLLGLESPAELKQQRLEVQVKQLRNRFKRAATGGANQPGERLLAWCALSGVADARDRKRCENIVSVLERRR